MFSVMGLGMQTEHSCCGAFTVAVGIIGLMTAKEGQTDVSNMEGYQMIAELTEFMLGFYGTLHCVELQKAGDRGLKTLPRHCGGAGQKLEELLAGRRIFRPVNGGQLKSADVPESEGLHERLFPIRKQTGRPVGDAALDTRSASALQNLGETGADRAILSHSPPPHAISLLLKISDWIPVGRILPAGTDRQRRRLGTAGPGV